MQPVMLVIIDGFGISEQYEGNAVKIANTANLDKIFKENPTILLNASGEEVGLPSGQMGNSEVGHTNIGAGRVVYQGLTKISKSIDDKSFFGNKKILSAFNYLKDSGGKLHMAGLLSDGGVHSHISHLYAFLDMAKDYGISDVNIHAWLDGRDVLPKSANFYVNSCKKKLDDIKIGEIVSISGRYYAMDRDNRIERTLKAYEAMAYGFGEKFSDINDYVNESYSNGITDEFIIPGVREGYQGISNKDVLICFNFRPDRARQITNLFLQGNKVNLDKGIPAKYLCLTRYDKDIKEDYVIYSQEKIKNTVSEWVSLNGLKQLKVAETEKYAHVTFFLNGGEEKPFLNESRILIPSPKVATYDLQPEMSADLITKRVISEIKENSFDFVVINYANCDMVGHTGSLKASVKAVESVDKCIGELCEVAKKLNFVIIISADHGNCEKMLDENKLPFTAHTTNQVPFSVVNYKCKLNRDVGKLADIAPTILDILNLEKPKEMEGESLIF